MLAHNSDRLGAVHRASHRRETELWQEHKHRLNEEGVVVNDNDTSVPLKPGAIPVSDGAGEVTAVGPEVTRWKGG